MKNIRNNFLVIFQVKWRTLHKITYLTCFIWLAMLPTVIMTCVERKKTLILRTVHPSWLKWTVESFHTLQKSCSFMRIAFLFFTLTTEKLCRKRFVTIMAEFPSFCMDLLFTKNKPLFRVANLLFKRFSMNSVQSVYEKSKRTQSQSVSKLTSSDECSGSCLRTEISN